MAKKFLGKKPGENLTVLMTENGKPYLAWVRYEGVMGHHYVVSSNFANPRNYIARPIGGDWGRWSCTAAEAIQNAPEYISVVNRIKQRVIDSLQNTRSAG